MEDTQSNVSETSLPYVEFDVLEPKALGGTRGAVEYRTATRIIGLVGKHGSEHVYEGECPECDTSFFGVRRQHRKTLNKCPQCGFTSFVYKGFWPLGETRTPEVSPPQYDDLAGDLYKVTTEDAAGRTTDHYGTLEWCRKTDESDVFTVVDGPSLVGNGDLPHQKEEQGCVYCSEGPEDRA